MPIMRRSASLEGPRADSCERQSAWQGSQVGEFGAQLKKHLTRWSSYKFLHETRLPSPRTKRLGTPNIKRFRGLLIRHCYDLLSCSPPFTGGFYFRAFDGSVTLPVAGYNYGGNWKIPPAGLSPAGSAASVAAPAPRAIDGGPALGRAALSKKDGLAR